MTTNALKLLLTVGILVMLIWTIPYAPGQCSTEMETKNAIDLPNPKTDGNTSLERSLRGRRSVRNYMDGPLRLREVSQLLWAAQGITDNRGYRTSPSAGALYPLEVYIVVGNVMQLQPGIYKYDPQRHRLVKIIAGDQRTALSHAALGQRAIENASAVIVFSAVYQRTTAKYGRRGVRYVFMETGHAAQNVCLQAVSLGLGTVAIGAFHDARVKSVVHLSPSEEPLYLMPVGRPHKK